MLSKAQILQNVWRYDFGGNSNVVETYVSYLRRKLDAAGPPLIKTVRQAGYMLEAERAVLGRLSLRARLLLGVIALAAVGLVAADVATYTSLRSFLLDRTDSSLDDDHAASSASRPGRGGDRDGPRRRRRGCARRRGDYVAARRPPARSSAPPAPRFAGPRRLAAAILPRRSICRDASATASARYFTVAGAGRRRRYRVRASVEPGATEHVLVVATSLADVDSTLHRLLLIELLVTAARARGDRGARALGRPARPAPARRDRRRRRRRSPPATSRAASSAPTTAPRSAGSGSRSTRCSAQIESAFRAREASERKLRRFVADASHELRTPLAAVRAYAELFTRGAAERPDDLARSMTGSAASRSA